MKEVYIKVKDLGWIGKHFQNKDLITIEELVCKLEDLDTDIEELEKKIKYMEQYCEDNHKSKW